MSDVWTPRSTLEKVAVTDNQGRHCCRARVHNENGWGFRQCGNLGKHEVDGVWWCGAHEPGRKAKREAQTEARQSAAHNKRLIEWRFGYEGVRLRNALREIANGHNDPRTLATEVLGKMLTEDF